MEGINYFFSIKQKYIKFKSADDLRIQQTVLFIFLAKPIINPAARGPPPDSRSTTCDICGATFTYRQNMLRLVQLEYDIKKII